MTRAPYVLRTVEGVCDAVVREPLTGANLERLRADRPVRVTIAADFGWGAESIGFLSELPFLEELVVVDRREINDVTAVGQLRNLRMLRLFTYARGPLDLSGLGRLREAAIIWNRRFTGLAGCRALVKLHIEKLTQSGMDELRGLANLKNLDIMDTRARDFSAIWTLGQLEKLRIALAPFLTPGQFEGLAALRGLRQLILQSCRQIVRVSPVSVCERMERLVISDCADLESITPLARLAALRILDLSGTTNVTDGDLSVLLGLPRLTQFGAASRRHYVPSVREVERIVEARGESE